MSRTAGAAAAQTPIPGAYRRELAVARRLAHTAGRAVVQCQDHDLGARGKANDQGVVTDADLLAHDIICSGLRLAFPNDAILSEEDAGSHGEPDTRRLWVVDPLDGTTGLIDGSGEFAIQIGLLVHGRIVLGVVDLPAEKRLYGAIRGCGTWVWQHRTEPRRVHVSATMCLLDARAVSSRAHRTSATIDALDALGLHARSYRHSVGVKVAALIEQECDVYLHVSRGTKWWDTCAPEIILAEAGGRLSDLAGRALVYSGTDLEHRCGILATNGLLHDTLVSRLRRTLKDDATAPLPA